MPSINDIINAATPGPWVHTRGYGHSQDRADVWAIPDYDKVACDGQPKHACRANDARFIATFDPTHESLQQAVINQAIAMATHYGQPAMGLDWEAWETDLNDLAEEIQVVVKELTAYRKERGLNE